MRSYQFLSIRRFAILSAFIAVPIFVALLSAAEANDTDSHRSVVWLDFQYKNWSKENWPEGWRSGETKINLAKEPYFGSAFLREIKRQAVLLAAREELGALTRDAFLGETAPEGDDTVKIEDVKTLFKNIDDFDITSRTLDYPEILKRWEEYSRNEFVETLQSQGVKKFVPDTTKIGSDETAEKELKELETLLRPCALIPNFNAIRRAHNDIHEKGETLPRLKNLVRAYSQMQILTNEMPRDTHRVFQARAILYAQRAVAKYGNENPQTLAETKLLRAAAWSYSNFHKIAREDFDAVIKNDAKLTDEKLLEILPDPWTRFAYRYANFDINGLEKECETLDEKNAHRPFARLLHYVLLSYAGDTKSFNELQHRHSMAVPLVTDLRHCERILHGSPPHWVFHTIPANANHAPFYDRLLRELTPQIRNIEKCPTNVSKAARNYQRIATGQEDGGVVIPLGNRGRVIARKNIDLKAALPPMGELLKAMRNTTIQEDSQELSFQALATIIEDQQFSILHPFATRQQWYEYHDELIQTARDAIGSHPLYLYLGFSPQNDKTQKEFFEEFKKSYDKFPFEAISQAFLINIPSTISHLNTAKMLQWDQLTCCFADRKNVRDMILYNNNVIRGNHITLTGFLMTSLYDICPNNPYVVYIKLEQSKPFDETLAKRCEEEFLDFQRVRDRLFELYNRNDNLEKMRSLFDKRPTGVYVQRLMRKYIEHGAGDTAIEFAREYLNRPEVKADQYQYIHNAGYLGQLLLEKGEIEEARQYLLDAASGDTNFVTPLSLYYEITGDFDKAEEIERKHLQSNQNRNATSWFAVCYRTEHEHLVYALDKVFEQYSTGKKNANTHTPGKVDFAPMLYVLRCMDAPMEDFVEEVGMNPDIIDFLKSGNFLSGYHAYFDALESRDEKSADTLLKLLMGQKHLVIHADIVRLKQKTDQPTTQDRQQNNAGFQMLAAIFALDQQGEKPGNLKPEEIDSLFQQHRTHGFHIGQLLYLIGRYFECCNEKEKAFQTYRRLLGTHFGTDTLTRALAVNRLRKGGLTKEEYLDALVSDPQIPTYRISKKWGDQLSRQLFREFSATPLESVLAKPVAKNPVQIPEEEPGKAGNFNNGYYRTTKILFRGEEISEQETIVYWNIRNADSWNSLGTAFTGTIPVKVDSRNEKGFYPVRIGEESDFLSAHAYFYSDKMVLLLSLRENQQPDALFPAPESDCVRIEMKKVK